jgi:hypothetical protein
MSKVVKIKSNTDIEINGRIYFIPDKYIDNKHLSIEYRKLYNIIIALYLDTLINSKIINSITKITKTNFNDAIRTADKLLNYIATGKIYISHLTNNDKIILDKIPESLIFNINPNIIEKIEL